MNISTLNRNMPGRRVILLMLFLLVGFSSCVSLKIWLDESGVANVADMILENYKPESASELENYLQKQHQPQEVLPASGKILISDLEEWRLDKIPIQRKITFPSSLKRENGSSDTAIFYLYSTSELEGKDVILWIPGFGVSDFAFNFIDTFFVNELNAGYAVLFYNIPCHLNRIEPGKEMGEGLFTGNNQQNLETLAHIQFEIKTAIRFLESKKVNSISGWGGSIGAAFLWLASAGYEFEHMTLMIPIVDWTTLIFHEKMHAVVSKMEKTGITEELLQRAYRPVSPINVPTLTDPNKIQVLYANHDQFTPESTIKAFAEKWHIRNTHGYEESHASILINDQLYKDNQIFLKRLQ